MDEPGYKRLIVWQKADELAKAVYLKTKEFPREELYGVTTQLRRAALSVPTNIVEGYARNRKGKKEIKQFLSIALGSLAETEYLLGFSCDLEMLNNRDYTRLQSLRRDVGGLLWKFFNSF